MSSAQPDATPENSQSETNRAPESGSLAVSVMNRARWMQRVLSPWTQRWLMTASDQEAAERSGAQRPFAGFIGADAQRTLARVQLQYESHTNLELPTTGGSMPLAGAAEKPSPAAEPTAPAAPASTRRAQGPYSRPFNSLEDFVNAIEAAKERNYAPPPAEAQPQPAPKRTLGPYSRPFQSMEEFVQAVDAARERNYAPPPAEQIAPPTPKRETGPYAHAFSSFEDFVKTVEETRAQGEATVAAEPPAPPDSQPSVPPTRIRPISRIEELPVRGEARPVASPIDLPAPPLAPAQPAATPAPQPVAASASPAVQRTLSENSAELSGSAKELSPIVQRSMTPAPQPQPAQPRSESAAPTASVAAAPVATLQSTMPPDQALEMPLVQRRPTESDTSVESMAAASVPDERAAPIAPQPTAPSVTPEVAAQPTARAARTVVQRQAKAETLDSEEQVPPEQPVATMQRQVADVVTPPVVEPITDRAAQPFGQPPAAKVVQPEVTTAQPPARAAMPLVQRQAEAEAPEMEEESTVQRQAIDVAPPIVESTPDRAAQSVGQPPAATVVQPEVTAQPTARAAMPLVQRQAEAEAPEMEEDSTVQRQAVDVAPPIVESTPDHAAQSVGQPPAATVVQPEVTAQPTARAAMPLVQRQAEAEAPEMEEESTVQRQAIDVAPPIIESAPDRAAPPIGRPPAATVVRPEVAAQPTARAAIPVVQRHAEAPEIEEEEPAEQPSVAVQRHAIDTIPAVVPPQPDALAAAHPSSMDMPLVQRQPAAPEAEEEIEQTEAPVQRQVDWHAPAPAGNAAPTAAPSEPVMQRQAAEIEPAQAVAKNVVAPLTDAPTPTPRIEMPLVQQQPIERGGVADGVASDQSSLAAPTASVLRQPTGDQATPRQPAAPIVQRQPGEPIAAAEPAPPSHGDTAVVPPVLVQPQAPLDMPLAQRQPPSQPSAEATAQRKAVTDGVEAEPSAVSDLSERILSRVAPAERRAAPKPIDLPLHRVSVAPDSEPVTAPSSPSASAGAAPLTAPSFTPGVAPAIQRMPTPVIQRTPSEGGADISSAETGFIQRVETVPEAAALAAKQPEATAAPVDLDQLARQVYPLIKRLIAIERERRAFR